MKWFLGYILSGFMLLAGAPSLAMDGDTYSALALSSDGRTFGFTNMQETKKKAFSKAVQACKKNKGRNCKVETWTTRCLAFAQGSRGSWGTGWHEKLRSAKSKALHNCSKNGAGCELKVAVCN